MAFDQIYFDSLMSLQFLSHSALADAYASLWTSPSNTASSSFREFPEIKLILAVNWHTQQPITECLCWDRYGIIGLRLTPV